MPIADFTNWTPEHCKRVIHKYQETRDEKLFDLLLLKYDKYLVKLAWRYRNRLNVSLEDVYHTAILGFGNAMAQFKPDAPAFIIMKVICLDNSYFSTTRGLLFEDVDAWKRSCRAGPF